MDRTKIIEAIGGGSRGSTAGDVALDSLELHDLTDHHDMTDHEFGEALREHDQFLTNVAGELTAMASDARSHASTFGVDVPADPQPWVVVVYANPDSSDPTQFTVHTDERSALADGIETVSEWLADEEIDLDSGPAGEDVQTLREHLAELDRASVDNDGTRVEVHAANFAA